MKTHELKTDKEVFCATMVGDKPYEIRYDDRGFEVGDALVLCETEYTGEEMAAGRPLIYTGRKFMARVVYILRGPCYGLKERWVIMTTGRLKVGEVYEPTEA